MRKRTFIVALGAILGACAPTTSEQLSNSPEEAVVVNVPDGDSLVVEIDGAERRVRLIGVNAPEYDECFGERSAAGLRELVDGERVAIITDVEPTDQYGRLLGYVFVGETFVNEEIVWRGWALARSYEPNTARRETIDAAGLDAREQQRGMWAPESCVSPAEGTVTIAEIRPNPPGPDEDYLDDETVRISNTGATPVDLTGWVLRDGSSVHRFTFPPGSILQPSAEVVVSSGCGVPEESLAFWCAGGPVWGNSGDSALLLDADGRVVATYEY
jgi:micrococcal nuclease